MARIYTNDELFWLAICAVTESSDPREWPYLMAVIVNRSIDGRFGGRNVANVVLSPRQFSFFNGAPKDHVEARAWALAKLDKRDGIVYSASAIEKAGLYASLAADGAFSYNVEPKTFYFWSPRSMEPAGSLPKWDWSKLRRYGVRAIDPWRWLFACEIA